MSEMFEQGGRYFAGAIGDVINDFTIGTGRILNAASKQIKPDALITVNPTLQAELQTASRTQDLSL